MDIVSVQTKIQKMNGFWFVVLKGNICFQKPSEISVKVKPY